MAQPENNQNLELENAQNVPQQSAPQQANQANQEDLVLLSEILKLNVDLNEEIISTFQRKAEELGAKTRLNAKETRWLGDFCVNHRRLVLPSERESSNRDVDSNKNFFEAPEETVKTNQKATEIQAIRLNELVKRPESFDGYKPPARKWLDDYEKCSDVNGWKSEHKVRYFSTFLEKSGNDWYVSIARRKLGPEPSWPELRAAFIRHYLGDSDKQVLRRQIEKTSQGDREKATTFIPRLVRLVELVDPNKSEEELVDMIRAKLRFQYQEKLTLCNTYTIEQLNDACLKIEASMIPKQENNKNFNKSNNKGRYNRQDNERNKNSSSRNERNNNQEKRSNKGNSNEGTSSNKKPRVCYRCEKPGHYANECRAKTKANGEPCNKRPESNRKQAVNTVDTDKNEEPEAKDKPSTSNVVSRIRAAGSTSLSTILINNVSSSQSLITHPLKLNGVEFPALVDTGAFVSVVNYQVVVEKGWLVRKSKLQLIHAAGDALDCVGEFEAEVEIEIGVKSMLTKHKFLVVKNLCTPVLMGLELMRCLKLQIDLQRKIPLIFQRGTFKKGIRLAETVELPARHVMMVKADISTTAKMVATIPFNFDNSIMVANSVDKIVNSKVKILLINFDNCNIMIKKGQIVASFQTLQDKEQNLQVWGINNVLPLGDSGSFVNVGDQLTEDEISELSNLLREKGNAFATNGQIGHTKLMEHKIILEKDARPFREKARRHPYMHAKEAKKQVEEMISQEIIEKSESPWCSEYVMVKKKTGDWRLCVDFRKLNSLTKKDSYPLPNIEDCLEQLGGKKYFSQMDFASGYWQLPVEESSRELTAFRANGELYQFKRLPFGLTNAPATFQRLINGLFAGLKGLNLQVFLDDVCLATSTWKEHLELLKQIFEIITKANLRLKPSKCTFGANSIKFLGHEISKIGLRPDSDKVKAISGLEPPFDISGVRRILGAFGYYRRFIPKYAEWSEPLVNLTRKKVTFNWGIKEQDAFEKIKQALSTCVTLTHLNDEDPILLKTDASLIGVAGILIQQQNKELRIVACVSRHLHPAEKNYSPMEIEALAIIYSLQKFRHYLLGRYFKIITDHNALKVLNSKTTRNARVERWALALSEYNCEILYQRGKLHEDVDCLSRSPVFPAEEQIANIVSVIPLDCDEWISNYIDDESKSFYEQAERNENAFALKNNLIYQDNKLYVPYGKRKELIKESHESNLAAHDGVEGTAFRMRNFWFPNIKMEIKTHVESCVDCQKRKVERRKQAGMMEHHECFQPMEIVAFDYIGPLPETLNKKRFIILGIDHFTRFVDAKAVKDQIAERFVRYFAEYCGRFGIPKTLVSDNGKQFDNKCLDSIREQFGTEHKVTPPGHSQGNAICERAIQSLSDKLAIIINNSDCKFDWDLALPMVLFSMNNKLHRSTGYAPFELLYGREAALVQTSMRNQVTKYDLHARVIRDAINRMRTNVIATNSDQQNRSKLRYDDRRREVSYAIDDLVLIYVKSRSKKLGPKFEGPYKIIEKAKDIYKLQNMSNHKDIRRRHVSQLKRFQVAIAMLLIATPIVAIPFQEVAPVFWEEDTDHFVSQGEETLKYVLHYTSPCPQIFEYYKLIGGNGNKNQVVSNNIQNPFKNQNTVMVQSKSVYAPIQQVNQPVQQQQQINLPLQQQQLPKSQIRANQQQQQNQQYNWVPSEEVATTAAAGLWINKEEAEQLGLFKVKRQISTLEMQTLNLYAECEAGFNRTIITTLSKFAKKEVPSKEKRQLGFVVGYLVSNIIQEVKNEWKGQPSGLESEFKKITNQFTTQQSILTTALRAVNKNQLKIQTELFDIKYDLNRLPSMEAFHTFIIAEMENKNLVLEEFIIGLEQGKTNTVLLAAIFKSQKFENLLAQDTKVFNYRLVNANTFELTLSGHIRSRTTKIYRVQHLDFYTNCSDRMPLRNEYTGRSLLIYNKNDNCAKAVHDTPKQYISDTCESNYHDKDLKLWRITPTKREDIKHSEYVRAGNDFFIYCWGNNISVAPSNSKQYKTTVCPSFPFKLNSSNSFRTSDEQIVHISKNDMHVEIATSLKMDVAELHFSNFKAAHEVLHEQYAYINKLLNQVDSISEEINATVISGTAITWKHLAITGLSGSSFFVTIFIIMYLFQKCKGKISFPNLQVFQAAATIRQEVRETVASELSNNLELVQVQVRRQVEDNFNEIVERNLTAIDRPMYENRRNRSRRSSNNVLNNYRFREI